jgi:hypothetical protein
MAESDSSCGGSCVGVGGPVACGCVGDCDLYTVMITKLQGHWGITWAWSQLGSLVLG